MPPHPYAVPPGLRFGLLQLPAGDLAAGSLVDLRIPHRDHQEVDLDLLVPDHGEDTVVPVRAVGVSPATPRYRLSSS